ncbi:hypothetical protein ACI6Q2_11455 [Chitinophagaceae bacterium LWZ2-11]
MSTFISFHIKSDDRNEIANLLQELSGVEQITEDVSYPNDLFRNILMVENADPSFLAVGNVENGWTTVYLNSFKKLNNWAQKISQRLDTTFIHVIGQNTSDVYYFLVYESGELKREIEVYHGDLENVIDKGDRLWFEKESLVPLHEEDYDNLFDIDTIEQYCKEFGFQLFPEVQPKCYLILRKKHLGMTMERCIASYKKPWWKFW